VAILPLEPRQVYAAAIIDVCITCTALVLVCSTSICVIVKSISAFASCMMHGGDGVCFMDRRSSASGTSVEWCSNLMYDSITAIN
jgi:hypothetical protein